MYCEMQCFYKSVALRFLMQNIRCDAVYGGSAIHKTIIIMNSLACFWFCTNQPTKIWTTKYNTQKCKNTVQKYFAQHQMQVLNS